MADATNSNMERHFFTHILDNPDQFNKVDPSYFQNSAIQLVYAVIQDTYLKSQKHLTPSTSQVLAMVRLNDPENKVSDKVITMLMENDNADMSDEWLVPRFKAWKIKNKMNDDVRVAIEETRGIENLSYENLLDIAHKLRNRFDTVLGVDDDDEDLGSDFCDPESHKQNMSKNCIPTGWNTMNTILSGNATNGGWSKSTLNVIMGETNVGKSMWLHNIASNAALAGFNVLIITLEMATHKVMKRLGAMTLKINVDEYDERSKDTLFMKQKINNFKSQTVGSLFDSSTGNIWVKKYNTSDCTVTDIDNYIRKFEEKKRLKVGMVIVDYINIMSIEKGYEYANMLYQKGKHLAEGLRRLADKYDCCIITATQTDKAVWGANDIKLADIPESKAIAETSDSVWGIIRNPQMKRENTYRLKILKLRDGEHKEEQIRFIFNPKFLSMEDDILVGTK